MTKPIGETEARRRFLRFVAGSPLLAFAGLLGVTGERLLALQQGESKSVLEMSENLGQTPELITSAGQASDVFDLEAVARVKIPPAHFGYLEAGVDDDSTVRANREGFTKLQIRARRLVDVRNIDMSVRLFGTVWDNPIILAPCGSQKAFNPEGEIAVAKAARSKGHLQILSTASTSSVEDVTAARGSPVWYQLYATDVWEVTRALLKRAEAAGCPAVVLTVDEAGGSNRETVRRFAAKDTRQCSSCHTSGFSGWVARKPMFSGLDISKVTEMSPKNTTWDLVKRIKDATSMKFLIKGILTREDAQLAVENGVDGIIVSNHGGRSVSSGRSTIESLPEVLQGADGKIPVLVDSGFRRGTDVFKALALGASAICIGRPYLWGLGAFGQPGVEAVLEIMRNELLIAMRQAGTTSIGKITPAYLVEHWS